MRPRSHLNFQIPKPYPNQGRGADSAHHCRGRSYNFPVVTSLGSKSARWAVIKRRNIPRKSGHVSNKMGSKDSAVQHGFSHWKPTHLDWAFDMECLKYIKPNYSMKQSSLSSFLLTLYNAILRIARNFLETR